jgi:hypothetical protein
MVVPLIAISLSRRRIMASIGAALLTRLGWMISHSRWLAV